MPLLLSVLLTLLAFTGLIPDTDQQQDHRIVLSLYDDFLPGEQHLTLAQEMNITIFEVFDPLQIRSFPEDRFNFFVSPGPDYAVPGILSQNINSIMVQIEQQYQRFEYEAAGRIAAAGILRYPYESHPGFVETVQSLADSVSTTIPVVLYFQSAGIIEHPPLPDGFNFVSKRVFPGPSCSADQSVVHFIPEGNQRDSYTCLNQVMKQLQEFDESILILPASWFFSQLDTTTELRYLFQDYTEGISVTLPLPAASQQQPYINWSIILLLLLWGSFAVHFRYQPMYSQSVIRYFTNHSFFVTDVYEHRLRNILPGLYLLIQHAFLTGLFVLACAEVLLSTQSFAVLGYHFPGLMLLGNNAFSLFTAGIIVAVLLQGISVLWIFFSNTELTSFSQILHLYSWPLHINLLVVTSLIVFIQVGLSLFLIVILAALFILIWFFSFNIAAIDSSRFLQTLSSKVIFLSLTVGVHIFLVLSILIYILFTPSILEPILFAIEIP